MKYRILPACGFDGRAPKFPLPDVSKREAQVWREAWKSPQAVAWIDEPWRWRTVALWVRWSVRMESDDASAALGNVVVRFADQIGMTPAGLRENGWQIGELEAAGSDGSGDVLGNVVDMFRQVAGDGG